MTDEVEKSIEEVQPQVETPSTEETAQGEEVVSEANTDLAQDSQTSNEEAPPVSKPTRSEKRIKDLAQKLAQAKNPEPDYGYDWGQANITPSEDGTITPEQLEQYVTAKANQIVETRLGLAQEQSKYQQEVENYLSDMERTAQQIEDDFKDNPQVIEKVNEMLTTINQKTNLDSSGKLTPRIKTSDLYQQLRDTLNLTRTAGKQEVSVKLAQQIAEGAITPSSIQPEHKDYSNLSAHDIWSNPSAVRESLEKRLKVASD